MRHKWRSWLRRHITLKKVLLALTVILAVATVVTISIATRYDRERRIAQDLLRAKTQENAALRKRMEAAEANTKLAIDRFAEAMKAFASEAGHLSGRSISKHEKSFVQVYGFYKKDRKNMATAGTACYLGEGYFLTAKHVVVPQGEDGKPAPKATAIQIRIDGQFIPVRLVDEGETEEIDLIDIGDWAVLAAAKVPEGMVPVRPKAGHPFVFGERLVRYGNDSNRGIAPAAGYVAQVSGNGWVSWLVDSLPGCSGGGVMNDRDELVGLNGGYLDGSTRLAVIIPIREEMFRRLPRELHVAPSDF